MELLVVLAIVVGIAEGCEQQVAEAEPPDAPAPSAPLPVRAPATLDRLPFIPSIRPVAPARSPERRRATRRG